MIQYSNGSSSNKKRTSKEETIIKTIVGFVIGFAALIIGVDGIINKTENKGAFGFVILAGILWLIFSYILVSENMAQYKVTEEGVLSRYPFERWKLISWDKFQEVCICYTPIDLVSRDRAFVIFCFIKHGEKKNKEGRWKTMNPLKYRKVIKIDYTKEMHSELKEKCPYKVEDLRYTPAYILIYQHNKFY